MSKTVFITGASTGIGLATAQLFQQQGWNVVATMRAPEKSTEFIDLPNVLCLPLDVTKVDTIHAAIDRAIIPHNSAWTAETRQQNLDRVLANPKCCHSKASK